MDEAGRKLIAELRANDSKYGVHGHWGYLDAYNIVVPCSLGDLIERCDGKDPFEFYNRFVADDYFDDKYRVSTIFLMLNHAFMPLDAHPQWFETMVFDANHKGVWSTRYETYKEAEEGHGKAVEMVKGWMREPTNAG